MGYLKWVTTGLAALFLTACEKIEEPVPGAKQDAEIPEHQALASAKMANGDETPVKTLPLSAFKTVEWTDLMPKDDLDALLNPPSYVTDIEDGSLEDQISSQVKSSNAAPGDDRYQQALASTRIIPEMDGQAIRIPGFIVPLEFDDTETITQFFLVPYFGACIHVPPPPPNQLIFVDYPSGVKLGELYDPVWIFGFLKTSIVQNEMATAAYSMQMQHFEFYTEE
ncbi:DUF3299 domain-containing protein [Alkalimarinus coralli]|uniref:DUF3299 domain-containing protein n=1 Tax=Alkalimarinus coralli TaxID=2935863 RepID=UPI00202AEF45|nr:DUF3299 domain-containing protein [Alkalimarinus coralli]